MSKKFITDRYVAGKMHIVVTNDPHYCMFNKSPKEGLVQCQATVPGFFAKIDCSIPFYNSDEGKHTIEIILSNEIGRLFANSLLKP